MTMNVAKTTNIVKIGTETFVATSGHPCGVQTMAERIRWILADRAIDQRALGKKAGLAESFVSAFLLRATKDPSASIGVDAAVAIAQAWGVSVRWLATGEGSSDSDDIPSVSEDSRPKLRNLPGWEDALKMARADHPDWDEWVWERAGDSSPFEAPMVNLALLVDVARLVRQHAGQGKQDLGADARRAEQAARLAAKLKQFEEDQAAGKPPPRPPPEVKPPRERKR